MAGPGQARFYSSTFVQTSISSGSIGAGTVQFNVGTTTGAPGTPFVISVDQNTASEELMLVTNVSGTQYTVTRAVGGTAAVGHANNAPVVHVMYSQDLTDSSIHIGSNDNVHGLAVGSLVVGTTSTQTLTNKTLTNPVINNPTISTPTISGSTTAGPISSTGIISGTEIIATGLTGAQNASGYVGATVSGAPVTGSFIVGNFIIDQSGLIWICTTAGSPGIWTPLINTSATQTLSNKTLTSAGAITSTAAITGVDFVASGLTGATAASRYVGGTSSGAPASGTFVVGDFVIDRTGIVWICTTAGSPGTWTPQINTSATQTLSNKTLTAPAIAGLTGAVAASRFAGATASGAPTSGTFLLGDVVVDQSGNMWVCTAGGTPGSWTPVGGAQGVTAAATTTGSNGTATSGTTETLDAVLGNYAFSVTSGRRYRVVLEGMEGSATANDLYRINIRNSGSASAPTTSSTVNASTQWFCPATGGSGQTGIGFLSGNFVAGSSGTNTIGVSYVRLNGTGALTPVGTRWLYVEDLGNV